MTPVYIPIVKGKANDCRAMARLSATARAASKPVVDLLPLDGSGSIDSHLSSFIATVACVAAGGPTFVDPVLFQNSGDADLRECLRRSQSVARQ